MTKAEAIKYIEQHAFIDDEVKDMCIEALEKQIPKKPNEEQKDCVEATIPRCPNCYSMFIEKYCAKCGQKILWGEEND